MTTATQVQTRRGTQAQCDAFTGVQGEEFVDTTNYHVRISDGSTLGGKKQASQAYVDAQVAGFSANVASNLTLWGLTT